MGRRDGEKREREHDRPTPGQSPRPGNVSVTQFLLGPSSCVQTLRDGASSRVSSTNKRLTFVVLLLRYEKQLEQEEQAYQQQRRRLYAEVQEEKERVALQAQKQRQELDEARAALEVSRCFVESKS